MAAVDLPLTLAALEASIASVDRRALLAPPRILRRVIKQDRQIATLGLRVPHRKSYLIEAEQLLKIVDRDELGLTYDVELSGTLILLARPDAEYLSSLTTGEASIKYWRLLFHVRVHRELDRKIADGALDAAAVRQRIERLGDAEFEEVRLVLRQEDLLLPPADDVTVYVEFAAVFLELKFFAPSLLRRYFPSLDEALVGAVLDGDLDACATLDGNAAAWRPHALTDRRRRRRRIGRRVRNRRVDRNGGQAGGRCLPPLEPPGRPGRGVG